MTKVNHNKNLSKMPARSSRPRAQNLDVTKFIKFNGRSIGVMLTREDTYLQSKSILYSKIKSIEAGKTKLPVSLANIGKRMYCFSVKLDGSLNHQFSF